MATTPLALRLAVTALLASLAMAPGAAAGGSGPRAGAAREFEPVGVAVNPIRVTDRVYYVRGHAGMVSRENEGFNSNAGFVVTDDGVVVFDALGTPALGAALLAAIRAITDQPVRRVIVSHYHADHFYGVQAFKAAGAEIWAHERVRDYLATDAPAARLEERRQSLRPWVNETTRVIPPDRYLSGSTRFSLGGIDFTVLPAGPAHTSEDIMLLVEQESVLFAGDVMFAGRVPFVGDADSRAWLAALDHLAAIAPRRVIVGHGPHSDDASADIDLTRRYLRYLREKMGAAVEELETFDEVYERTDWSPFAHLPAFEAANRGNAYNTYLLMQREALERGN
jgi:glyoxylase-like metal-dependent hydrolase (beta-lactamase superfamily II)